MNRNVPPLAIAALALFAACNGKASRQECTEMLDRYVDMTIADDPSLKDLGEEEARAAREMKIALRRGEAPYLRVQDQCEAEISRSEYRCAMKADSPARWEACID